MSTSREAIYRALYERRSIRKFQPTLIEQGAIERILNAACQAPSAHNRQPWRFVVLGQGETRRKLVQAMGKSYKSDLQGDGVPASEAEARVSKREAKLLAAPVAILLCLSKEGMAAYGDTRRSQAEREMAVQSVALAGANILLAAQGEGLGACWFAAPLFAPAVVREVLELPTDWEPQAMIVMGIPAEDGAPHERKAIDEVTLWG
jgi:coenzyme F420-0:L-glutamate ligase/coenzyme F420-1:gamma-L-glutamate ligase